jgi:hypothetical protein
MAFADSVSLRQQVFETDPQFAALEREHHDYEEKLNAFAELHYLSPEEQMAEAILKKKKLHVRDQMEEILSRYQVRKLNDR